MLMTNGKEEQGRELRQRQGQGEEEGERREVAKKQSWTEFILGAREREFRLHDPRVLHGRLVDTRAYECVDHTRRVSPFRDSCDSLSDSDVSGCETKENANDMAASCTDLEQILKKAGPHVPVVLFLVPRPACALSRYLGKRLCHAIRTETRRADLPAPRLVAVVRSVQDKSVLMNFASHFDGDVLVDVDGTVLEDVETSAGLWSMFSPRLLLNYLAVTQPLKADAGIPGQSSITDPIYKNRIAIVSQGAPASSGTPMQPALHYVHTEHDWGTLPDLGPIRTALCTATGVKAPKKNQVF